MHLHLLTVAGDFAYRNGMGGDLDRDDLAALVEPLESGEDLGVVFLHHEDVLEAPHYLLREVLVVVVEREVPGEDDLALLILSHSPEVFG